MSPIQRSQDDVDSASKEINYETDTDGIIQNSSCIVSFLHLIQDLKINKRRGWLKMGIPFDQTESIADHMYRMSLMVQLIQDPAINKEKCIKMALVHDMAEAITTDIIPDDNISSEEKKQMEADAMYKIKMILGDANPFGKEAENLWNEYSSDSTIDAHLVKDIDKLELILQAVEYEKRYGVNFGSWIVASKDKIRHSQLKEWLNEILKFE